MNCASCDEPILHEGVVCADCLAAEHVDCAKAEGFRTDEMGVTVCPSCWPNHSPADDTGSLSSTTRAGNGQ